MCIRDRDMKLIDAEYTFDNNKVLFYFTADGRIDFRELVKDLASVFKTRIELRQIGAVSYTHLRKDSRNLCEPLSAGNSSGNSGRGYYGGGH